MTDVPHESGDALVGRVEATRDALRAQARDRVGVTGSREAPPPLRQVLRDHGLSVYPLFALGVLAIVDSFQSFAFAVLGPEVAATLGIGKGTLAAAIAIGTLAGSLGPLPVAALTANRTQRALVIVATGFAWSLVAISSGFVTALAGLIFVLILDGLTTASVNALHIPFLLDSYPPAGRVRALSHYIAANSFGNILAPLLVALFAAVFALTWRGVFVALGTISFASVLLALRLRDPGYGRWDTEQIRAAVREHEGRAAYADVEEVTLRFFEVVRRLLLIPTVRRLLVAQIAFGVFVIPYRTFLAFFLDERWNLGPVGRGVFSAFIAGAAILGLTLFGKRGEALYRRSPFRLMEVTGTLYISAVACIVTAALVPVFGVMVALFGLASGILATVIPALNIAVLSVIPSRMRAHTAALIGIATAVGGFGGSLLLGGVDSQYGIVGTIVALSVPGAIGALILRSAAPLVVADLDRMIDEILEDEEIRQITSGGGRLPMLACRKIEFAYGQIQVLFDVDFTVDDGEIVALLGTNGAGKSTLLKVISGIGLPLGGSVRYRGADITYLEPERRLKLGIAQVPGGRAVFGPMDVIENLRIYGHSLGRNRRTVDEAIQRSLAAFPRLAERRKNKASTLSGGEQQMLGLAKALMLQPRLLLVDELSLGLAPVVVAELLDMVRAINAHGTAVVLVEQSVNIALNLVDHAYFMEKGEIRFDGASAELLRRDDLLRAVFLEGTARDQP